MSADLRAPSASGGGGEAGPDSFVFEQDVPASTWTVAHGLGFFPSVTIVDTLDREFEGAVAYVDDNTVTVTFAVPVTGKAFCS